MPKDLPTRQQSGFTLPAIAINTVTNTPTHPKILTFSIMPTIETANDTLRHITRLEDRIQTYINRIQYDYSATSEDKALMKERIEAYEVELDELRKGGKDG
jgi:hypothetical protein